MIFLLDLLLYLQTLHWMIKFFKNIDFINFVIFIFKIILSALIFVSRLTCLLFYIALNLKIFKLIFIFIFLLLTRVFPIYRIHTILIYFQLFFIIFLFLSWCSFIYFVKYRLFQLFIQIYGTFILFNATHRYFLFYFILIYFLLKFLIIFRLQILNNRLILSLNAVIHILGLSNLFFFAIVCITALYTRHIII